MLESSSEQGTFWTALRRLFRNTLHLMVSFPPPHLSESPVETDSVRDATEDGQLTIRIPNPKVYMARQSQWKGRRGKPRCDHCRINNLKVCYDRPMQIRNIVIILFSAIGFFRRVTTVPGPTVGSADIHLCPHQLTAAFPVVTGVDLVTSRCVHFVRLYVI